MKHRLLLNHIVAPTMSVVALLELSHRLGLAGIELRNDIGPDSPLNGASAAEVSSRAFDLGQEVFSINALQRCDDAHCRPALIAGMRSLAELAVDLGVRAIVMCPVNDHSDRRSSEQRFKDLVTNLMHFAPILEDSGIIGMVEPLGFPQSSLRSARRALDAVRQTGKACFAVVLDSFHFALGTDTIADAAEYPVDGIGLVHLSAVEEELPRERLLDNHRLLVTERDRLETLRLLSVLDGIGFRGPYSLEPFSPAVQRLSVGDLESALAESVSVITNTLNDGGNCTENAFTVD